MSLRINNNIASLNAYRNLSVNDNMMAKSLEKLSSGFRINRAADDAAGLVKSEGLRAEVRGSQQAIRNAQDGVSFVQTAEGALNEVHSILQRMRELAVSAANTATSDGVAEQAEFSELQNEIDSIGSRLKRGLKKDMEKAGVQVRKYRPLKLFTIYKIAHRTHRRVLVIDDNRDSAESTALLLQLRGHDVRTALDGESALQTARCYRPEVVLLESGNSR